MSDYELGKPAHFDVDMYLDCVDQMVSSDEVLAAYKMLEIMPAYYREHVPERAKQLKLDLDAAVVGVSDYQADHTEIIGPDDVTRIADKFETLFCHPRAGLTLDLILNLNSIGIEPHITELGPADYWLPAGLKRHRAEFSYSAATINSDSLKSAKNALKEIKWSDRQDGQTEMFCCFETIEHMVNPEEIKPWGIGADYILLSTPLYTMGGGMKHWRGNRLGHLRTWTPKELREFAEKLWPNYLWQIQIDFSMVLIGARQTHVV